MNALNRTAALSPALLMAFSLCMPVKAVAESPATEEAAYAEGTRAMNDSRWADAVVSFDQVVVAKGRKADAALYWKAYSLGKLGKPQLVEATCTQLRAQYKTSQWNQDCATLRVTSVTSAQKTGDGTDDSYRFDFKYDLDPPAKPAHTREPRAPRPPRDPGEADSGLKILALNSLLKRDPAQAIPILKSILTGDQPESVKKHALFVLEQSKSPEAHDVLHDLVLGKQGPELQREAIQGSAVFQGKHSNDALAEVYKTTTDARIKKSIISAFFITQDTDRMVEIARAEKDLELKRTIVSQLSLMPGKAATDYMMELLK